MNYLINQMKPERGLGLNNALNAKVNKKSDRLSKHSHDTVNEIEQVQSMYSSLFICNIYK